MWSDMHHDSCIPTVPQEHAIGQRNYIAQLSSSCDVQQCLFQSISMSLARVPLNATEIGRTKFPCLDSSLPALLWCTALIS